MTQQDLEVSCICEDFIIHWLSSRSSSGIMLYRNNEYDTLIQSVRNMS
jgi:hypothetical protein